MDLLADLSEPQREAVTHKDGPLLIIAGAGSGKTRVVTRRIGYLIRQGVDPYKILALTFTNKAAGEMKERVAKLCAATNLWISTFHSTAVRILRREIKAIGYSNDFTIYDEDDSLAAVKEALSRLNMDPSTWRPPMLANRISRAKNSLVGPDEFRELLGGGQQGQVIASVYKKYEEILKANNALDFDDLLVKLLVLFQEHSGVLARYQEKFQYILIDEYQDTNRCQYILAKSLAAHRNICATGDPDQSIYTWRGADIQNILDFEKDYPEAKVVKLEQNYRSTKRILQAASELIKNNRLRKEKTLWTNGAEGTKVRVVECEDEEEEAEAVAERIAELRGKGLKCSDFAIFYRVNAQSRAFEAALRNKALPYTIVGGLEFYQRREVKDVLAYLRLTVNPSDDVSFNRIANVPPRGVGDASLDRLKAWAQGQGSSLLAAVQRGSEVPGISGKAVKGLQELKKLFEQLSKLPKFPVAEVVRKIIRVTEFEEHLRLEGPQGLERIENVEELVTAAAEYDERAPEGNVAGFLEEVALVADVDTWDDRANAVTLMTLHSAKGLEFPAVFITGLEEGLFPHERAMAEGRDLEEERRLCYVGITRTKLYLTMTYARARTKFGLRSSAIPSRFLSEVPDAAVERIQRGVRVADEEPRGRKRANAYWSGEAEDESGLLPGDTVRHPKYGVGHIMALDGWGESRRARVKFRVGGEQTLVLKYAKLEKLE